jgi:protein involved in polysaccharide export with SLBB domain
LVVFEVWKLRKLYDLFRKFSAMKNIQAQGKNRSAKRKANRTFWLLTGCSLLFLAFSFGCGNKFFDPTQVGRFRPVPSVNVILDSLGVAEETPVAWEQGQEPRASDTVVMETDYVFRSGDIVRISIFELLQNGVTATNDYVVTETGKISIPDVGVVEAAGLTETQLEEEIRQILRPSILKDPSVTVTLMASQQRTFSILGDGISAPGRYVIPRYDFRLADALATAGGQRQFNVSYIYVSRNNGSSQAPASDLLGGLRMERPEPKLNAPSPGETEGTEDKMLEIITPRAQGNRRPASNVVISSSEMATTSEFGSRRPSGGYGSSGNLTGLLSGGSEAGSGSTQAVADETELETGSATSVGAEMWRQPENNENEQVSVADILKTLAERSKQEKTVDAATNGADNLAPPTRTIRPAPKTVSTADVSVGDIAAKRQAEPAAPAGGEAGSLDSIMKTLADRTAAKPVDKPAVGGAASPPSPSTGVAAPEPGGVDGILKSLEERAESKSEAERGDWENVLKSFAEPQPGEEKAEAEVNLDDLLKSFAEPDTGVERGEQIKTEGVGDVDFGVVVPMDEQPVAPVVGPDGQVVGVREEPGRIEWVFQDGKWVPMQVGAPTVAKPMIRIEPREEGVGIVEQPPTGGMEWVSGTQTRLLKIPADKLMSGDQRYNIVIKPGDSIYVPVDVIGEFCVMGNVNRQGYIPITGRPMTLKMAIAAAGGLGPLAMPKRCEVTRRIGRKKEEIVMVDLDKIASGAQPDFFIKPNDLINVGTDATARWRAVLRNAFRATYGFGFVYDRNFALDNYYSSYGRSSRVDLGEAIKIF